MFDPSGLDAVVLPTLGRGAINVVVLLEVCGLLLVPTIGLGLNSRIKSSWRNRRSAHSDGPKYNEDATNGSQDFVSACHGWISVVGSLPNTCTISADFWTFWLLAG